MLRKDKLSFFCFPKSFYLKSLDTHLDKLYQKV